MAKKHICGECGESYDNLFEMHRHYDRKHTLSIETGYNKNVTPKYSSMTEDSDASSTFNSIIAIDSVSANSLSNVDSTGGEASVNNDTSSNSDSFSGFDNGSSGGGGDTF